MDDPEEKAFVVVAKRELEKTKVNLSKVGKSYEKVGNANYRYKGYLITKSDEDGEIIVFKPNGRDVAFRGTKSEDMAKDWIDHHSVGNKTENSASDDKFAYVMREFDEGKLKTPDGKIVTDPAQAKAIAYSESKKTENGCARARNAMACNKKVRNSIYSELNKSDKRVVIEADGSWYVYDKNDKVIEQGRESNADNALGKFKAKGYNKKIGNAMVKNIATYKDFTRDLDKAIMLEVSGINYNNVDEQTLKQWVEQAKKDGYASAIKGLQGKKLILDVY
jgi:hypothetical protein